MPCATSVWRCRLRQWPACRKKLTNVDLRLFATGGNSVRRSCPRMSTPRLVLHSSLTDSRYGRAKRRSVAPASSGPGSLCRQRRASAWGPLAGPTAADRHSRSSLPRQVWPRRRVHRIANGPAAHPPYLIGRVAELAGGNRDRIDSLMMPPECSTFTLFSVKTKFGRRRFCVVTARCNSTPTDELASMIL